MHTLEAAATKTLNADPNARVGVINDQTDEHGETGAMHRHGQHVPHTRDLQPENIDQVDADIRAQMAFVFYLEDNDM